MFDHSYRKTVRTPGNSVGVAIPQPRVEVRSASTLGAIYKRWSNAEPKVTGAPHSAAPVTFGSEMPLLTAILLTISFVPAEPSEDAKVFCILFIHVGIADARMEMTSAMLLAISTVFLMTSVTKV